MIAERDEIVDSYAFSCSGEILQRPKWTMQATAFCLAVAAFAAVAPVAAQSSPEMTTQQMPFDQCLAVIQASAADLGVAPVDIVETDTVRMVRFLFSDGSVLITCSAIGNTMAVTLNFLMCDQGGNC